MSATNDDTVLPPPRKPSHSNGLDGETVLPSNNTTGIHSPGALIDNRYKVIREIGRGGMGVVYEVLDALTDDHYAVKRLLPFFASRPEIVKQFWIEGAASMRFTNQSRLFVTTQTVGQDQGLPYIVMELVSYPTLRAIMNKAGAGMALNDALSVLKAVAASLAELHSIGYIHRDLKPENIFISEHAGNVTAFLSDFGLIKDGLASTATVMKGAGTERYASPEQKKGLPTTPATDVYAFGVIAYEMLTGELPTYGESLTDFVPDTPEQWVSVITKCLTGKVERRIDNAITLSSKIADTNPQSADVSENTGDQHVSMQNRDNIAGENDQNVQALSIDQGRTIQTDVDSLIQETEVISKSSMPTTTDSGVTRSFPKAISTFKSTGLFPHLERYVSRMCLVPAGTIEMGAQNSNKQYIDLSGFWLGSTPVTVGMWNEYCLSTNIPMPMKPSWRWRSGHPVINVSWNDIMGEDGKGGFCAWASAMAGGRLTLPTETQFEYAARGGQSRLEYRWGNTFDRSNLWCSSTSIGDSKRTALVVRQSNIYRNAFGLTDMAGNVWQWCTDSYGPDGVLPQACQHGFPQSSETRRQVRGGSWYNKCSISFRCGYSYRYCPDYRRDTIGFRLAAGPG